MERYVTDMVYINKDEKNDYIKRISTRTSMEQCDRLSGNQGIF